jgi:hypothetical protein
MLFKQLLFSEPNLAKEKCCLTGCSSNQLCTLRSPTFRHAHGKAYLQVFLFLSLNGKDRRAALAVAGTS